MIQIHLTLISHNLVNIIYVTILSIFFHILAPDKHYYLVHKNLDNILHPLKNGFHNVAFLLGIGYRDQDMPYFKNKRKPKRVIN